jgi:SAM-dependent methyltransferase
MSWSYDAIAEVYATDMGRSMPFDDVAFYRSVAQQQGGATLELGCGTGRILLELLAAGIDAFGADRSLPMLQRLRRDAQERGLAAPRVLQMDLRGLALDGRFACVMLPYSLLTYLTDARVAAAVLAALRSILAPRGAIVLDAFVPQPVASFADFRLDYRREHGSETLERHKRITAHADGTNRIERRYRLYAAGADAPREEFFTDETIRPYRAADLAQIASTAGLKIERWVYDYGTRSAADGARFVSAIAMDAAA